MAAVIPAGGIVGASMVLKEAEHHAFFDVDARGVLKWLRLFLFAGEIIPRTDGGGNC